MKCPVGVTQERFDHSGETVFVAQCAKCGERMRAVVHDFQLANNGPLTSRVNLSIECPRDPRWHVRRRVTWRKVKEARGAAL